MCTNTQFVFYIYMKYVLIISQSVVNFRKMFKDVISSFRRLLFENYEKQHSRLILYRKTSGKYIFNERTFNS